MGQPEEAVRLPWPRELVLAESLVYLNGQLLDGRTAALPLFDAGIVLGATVSEFTRTFRQRLYRLDDHIARFCASLNLCQLDSGHTPQQLADIARDLVARHASQLPLNAELGVVHFVTAGEYPTYAGMAGRPLRTTPTVCVHTFPLALERWARKMVDGVRLVTPTVRAVPAACIDPRIKCRSRMHWFLAEREVQAVEPGANALLLDLDGYITEASTANFLMVEHGTIVSPPEGKILPGISRAVVMELAARLGIAFVDRNLTVEDLGHAEEAFLTSTPYCLIPVTSVNGISVGRGPAGPIYQRLVAAWSTEVGVDIAEQIQKAGASG